MRQSDNPPGERIALGDKLELLVDVFAPSAPTHIFNTPEFFRLHAGENGTKGHYFQLAERKSRIVLATLHFTQTSPGFYRSPARGTFGGISAPAELSLESIEALTAAAEAALRNRGAANMHIVMPPASHDASMLAKCFNVFTRQGFGMAGQEINYDLEVSNTPFSERIDYGNRKRLNKCLREGFAMVRLGPECYEPAYQIIAENRRRKGYPVTMDFAAVMAMVDTFGDRMRFFGVTRDSELVAAAICIAVSAQVMSVFYWGDREGVQDYSPVVLLSSGIYEHCQEHGIAILDTGIATEAGEPNHGLIRFKRSLGLRESLKLAVSKDLSGHA